MIQEVRRNVILDLLRLRGSITVGELQKKLEVSDMTIRRDLDELCSKGFVRRVRGGAVLNKPGGAEPTFSSRLDEEMGSKRAIGRIAVTYLSGGEILFLDSSTTCNEVARLLPDDEEFIVITDSLSAVLSLKERKKIDVILLGGTLERNGNTFGGIITNENASKMSVDYCFFSPRGFTDYKLTNFSVIGAETKKIMINRAKTSICLADSTKYNKNGLVDICTWESVDVFITDSGLTSSDLENIEKQKVEIKIAQIDPSLQP